MMTLRPGRLLRPAGVTFAVLALVAVLLGRSSPTAVQPRSGRRPAYPRYVAVDCDHFADRRDPPRVLDTETGRVARLSLPDTDHLYGLACSPWADGDGRFRLVGFWAAVAGRSPPRLPHPIGLARYAFPGGRTVEGRPCELMPWGRLCWSPDRGDRVVFAGGDGRLYRCDLPADARDAAPAACPLPIAWGSLPPGVVDVRTGDPAWPAGGGIGGRVLVALSTFGGPPREFVGPRLWWLRLAPGGEAVEAAGQLIEPGGCESPGSEDQERLPAFVTREDGRSALAFLRRGAMG